MIEHLQVIHGEHLIVQMLHLTGKDKEKFVSERRFKCRHCKRLFTVRKSLVSHLEKIHFDFSGFKYGTATVNSEQIHVPRANSDTEYTPAKIVIKKPPERKRTSISKYLEDYHTDISQNPAINACSKCPQVFPRKSILDMHIRMSHKNEKDDEEDIEIKQEIKVETPEIFDEEDTPIIQVAKKARKSRREQKNTDEFYSAEDIAKCQSENHHLFYEDSVPCEANADPSEEREPCIESGCDRKFISYFSMMRHVAFFHRPEKTAKIMKLKGYTPKKSRKSEA